MEAVDKYGFAYFIATKINVSVVIIASAAAVKYGMDLPAVLSSWGISR